MDNKKFYILMFAVMVLTLGWYAFIQKVIRPKHPEWDWTNQQAQNASQTQPSGAGTESISQGPARKMHRRHRRRHPRDPRSGCLLQEWLSRGR